MEQSLPYADPEKKRAYDRAHREQHAAVQRTYYAAHRKAILRQKAAYDSAHCSDRMIARLRLDGQRALEPFTA